jgi:lipoyl(octanoyl) transferase
MADGLTDQVGRPIFQNLAGPHDYAPTIDAMRDHAAAIRSGRVPEAVWLLEHAPVYTAGTSAKDADLLNPGNTPTHKTGRGGQWTYHGPGQRVAYVMLDLQKRGPDVRCYVHNLEGWIIDVLAGFDVTSQRRTGLPGIWVETGNSVSGFDKIAAIGVRISRWISWHGIAINNYPDLTAFQAIVPCGVSDGGVTSLAALGVSVNMNELDDMLQTQFDRHFPKGP